ncbi:MAG: hypothetical protein JNK56_26170 [Myxococcales bacterium]|nr:hypothetical protein [Myxococcales bacterium]
MSKFESTFKAAIAENERRILIDSLRASPDLSLGEIHKLSKGGLGRLFSEITIADLLGTGGSRPAAAPAAKRGRKAAAPAAAAPAAGRRGGKGKAAKAPKAEAAAPEAAPAEGKGAKGRRGKAKAVNTRTAEGRAAYDESLFQAVKDAGGPAGAGALIAVAGGTSLQARAGLARLIEAGRITWSGKARGTKYSVA